MKKTVKFLAVLLMLVMVASTVSAFAFGEYGASLTADDYDKYGYYVNYDFESYTGGHPVDYFRNAGTKIASGLVSDPFDFVTEQNAKSGTATAVKENGNTYVHYVHAGANYSAFAVFEAIDQNGKDAILGDAMEISFRLRMSAGQATTATPLNLINVRRSTANYGDNITYLRADVYGNLYVRVDKEYKLAYTNGDGKTVGGDGEFMNISFVWFDTTNCFNVYVNGYAVAEGIPFAINYASDAKVIKTYDDNFNLKDLSIVGDKSSEAATRTIELLRPDVNEAFEFDFDDLKLSRYEAAQRGAVYYENSFEGAVEGISKIQAHSTYVYKSGASTSNIKLGFDSADKNGYLEVSKGQYVALSDYNYQMFTRGNLVVDFSVKGTVDIESGYASLVRLNNYCHNSNVYTPIVVDKNGSLYIHTSDTAYDRIDGYRLSNDGWLDITVVAIKNIEKYGKFGTFSSTSPWDSIKDKFFFAVYINGNIVGVTGSYPFSRFSAQNKEITASGLSYTITDHTDVSALNLDSLTLIDDTTTKNHKIYKSVVDGVTTYYDVTFSDGNATKYSKMVLGNRAGIDNRISFFSDTCFDVKLDNVKVYAGTAPESAYAAASSVEGGTVLNVDFSKFTFSPLSFDARTHASGSSVLGTFISSGFVTADSIHKDANGNAITADTALNSVYTTLKYTSSEAHGNWFDYYVPMPVSTDGTYDFTYSFKTSLKGFTFDNENAPEEITILSLRFEDDAAAKSGSFIRIDRNLNIYAGSTTDRLYNANGMAVVLDNNSWNELSADVHFVKNEDTASAKVSFFLNGQPLYFADGTGAVDVSGIVSNDCISRIGVDNVRLRLMPNLSGYKAISFDVKNLTVEALPKPVYTDVNSTLDNFSGAVTAIDLTLPCYTAEAVSGKYTALALTKTVNGATSRLPLIAVDSADNSVYVGIGGQYYGLLNEAGEAITIPDAGLPMTIVYNDIDGMARYYVDGKAAYVKLGLEPTMAAEIGVYDMDFSRVGKVGTCGYVVFGGYATDDRIMDETDYKLATSAINKKDGARVIGFQENSGDRVIRLIAGLDSLYYTGVGFEVEGFENGVSDGVKNIDGRTVYESIAAGDDVITAGSYGYKYLAAFAVTDIPEAIGDNSYILVRSYTEVNGVKHYDSEVKVVVTRDGYFFDNDGTVYQNNFNGITGLPYEWKLAGDSNGKASVTSKGEIEFIHTANDKAFLYLNQYVGEEYVFQFDVSITDIVSGQSSYLAPMFGYVDVNKFGWITTRAETYTPQGIIERFARGNWESPDEAKFTLSDLGGLLEVGKQYTITVAAKKTDAGTSIAYFVNGAIVKQYTFDGYDNKGFVGIGSKGVSMLIDNVIVKTGEYAGGGYFNYTKSFKDDTTLPSDWTAVDTHAQGIVEITNTNALRVTSSGDALPQLYLKNLTASDYVVEANITMRDNSITNGYFGIVVRATKTGTSAGDLNDSINCAFRVGGYGGWIQGDNTTNLTPEGSPVIVPGTTFVNGQTYNFKVECNGKTIKFYLDGTLVGTGTIPAGASKYDTGTIGFAGKRVIFDVEDVKVTALDGTPLYEEDFDKNTNLSDNWRMLIPNGSNFNIGITEPENKLAIKETLSGNYITQAVLDPEKVPFSDYTVSADFAITANSNYFGITARYSPTSTSKRFVLAAVRQNGTGFIESMEDGKWVPNSSYTFDLGRKLTIGEIYELKVKCEGNQIYFYIDGVEVAKGEIPAGFEEGTVGVGSKGSCVEVDNFKVSNGIELYEIIDPEKPVTRIRVATFNTGDFSTGSGTCAIIDEKGNNTTLSKGNGTEVTKAEYRDVFAKLGVDIWALQEDSEFFSHETKEKLYDAVYNASGLTTYKRNFTGAYNGKAFLTSFDIYDVEPVYYNKIYTSYSPDTLVGYSHPWFLTAKIMVDGKEINIATLHFEWSCKEKRFQQIRDVLAWAADKEYCIILGDFNPENYINGTKVADPNDEHYVNGSNHVNMYQVDWKFFTDAGFEAANGGRFGAFPTLMGNGSPRNPYPWDSIFVSSNIKIVNAEPVYEPWMCDHAIFMADIELN